MMLEIIQGLCESNDFDVYDFDSGLEGVNAKIAVPPRENDANQEYYFLLEANSVNDEFIEKLAKDSAEELMDRLEALDYTDESFRKNSTLILCCNAASISDSALLKFEEDPYFFKKNVITYSDDELSSLRIKLNNEFNNDHINILLIENRGELFESFKTMSLKKGHYYSLLIRTITKLPFVHYLPQPNNLEDLNEFVRGELIASDLKLFDYILDGDDSIDNKISADWGEL